MHLVKNLKLIKRQLKRFLAYNVKQTLEDFSSYLPEDDDDNLIPNQQSLHFTLSKLQGSAMILDNLKLSTLQATRSCMQLLFMGNFFAKNSIFIALLGSFYESINKLLDEIVETYRHVYRMNAWFESPEQGSTNFSDLPSCLKTWLSKDSSASVHSLPEVASLNPKLLTQQDEGVVIKRKNKRL